MKDAVTAAPQPSQPASAVQDDERTALEDDEPAAWECASPTGERPALAFLTSKKPTLEHYESQGWRVTKLYTASSISRLAVKLLAERAARAASPQATTGPVNGIPATLRHGEGAIARCFYCGRYSLDPKTLSDRQPKCECGEKHGWSGSFKKPGPDAKWSGAAPEPTQATATQPAQTEQSGIDALFASVTDWMNAHRIPFEAQNELFRILAASLQPVAQTRELTDEQREALKSAIAGLSVLGWTHRVPVLSALLTDAQPAPGADHE